MACHLPLGRVSLLLFPPPIAVRAGEPAVVTEVDAKLVPSQGFAKHTRALPATMADDDYPLGVALRFATHPDEPSESMAAPRLPAFAWVPRPRLFRLATYKLSVVPPRRLQVITLERV